MARAAVSALCAASLLAKADAGLRGSCDPDGEDELISPLLKAPGDTDRGLVEGSLYETWLEKALLQTLGDWARTPVTLSVCDVL